MTADRRQIGAHLNIQESRHQLARPDLPRPARRAAQRYREGQEDQLGALGLVLNGVVLRNTRHMDLALSELRRLGIQVQDEDVARLSPLVFRDINFLGRYAVRAGLGHEDLNGDRANAPGRQRPGRTGRAGAPVCSRPRARGRAGRAEVTVLNLLNHTSGAGLGHHRRHR